MKSRLFKLHFWLIFLILICTCVHYLTSFTLKAQILFSLKLIVFFSGVICFFLFLKTSKKIAAYFSLYVLSPILVGIAWFADGIFGALVASVFLFFLIPPDTIATTEGLELRTEFRGFLGHCCGYEIYESKFLLLEKKIGRKEIQESSSDIISFTVDEQSTMAKVIAKDSVFVIDLQIK
ncbi:MAG: hypothetical protein ACO1OQ_09515 [Rufibacter sp.]